MQPRCCKVNDVEYFESSIAPLPYPFAEMHVGIHFLSALLSMVLTQMLTRGLRSQVARSFSTGGVPRKVLITGPPGGGA